MLVSAKDMMDKARDGKYAVGIPRNSLLHKKGLSPSPFLSLTLFHVLSKLLFLFKMSYMFLYIG